MVEIKVTCDRCKKQIRLDRENFFQVTVQQKDVKPDGTIFPIDQWSRVICEDCQAVLDSPDAEEREKKQAAVEEKQAAVSEKKQEAAVEKVKVAPVQQEKKKVDHIMVKVLMKQGWNQQKIAKELGVTPAAISQIVKKYKEYKEMEE